MAKVCEICGKGPVFGHNVSHANNKTRKVWHPNLHKVKAIKRGKDDRNEGLHTLHSIRKANKGLVPLTFSSFLPGVSP